MNNIPKIESYIPNEWVEFLGLDLNDKFWKDMNVRLNRGKYYPERENIFRALKLIKPEDVRVIILGQDPYHNGSADGLAFSCKTIQKSLEGVLKEIKREYDIPQHVKTIDGGNLGAWCEDGVLLLNTILTVEPRKPKSHESFGWTEFTDMILQNLDTEDRIIMAWGGLARMSTDSMKNIRKIFSPHPSPINTTKPFSGCGCFTECNKLLRKIGYKNIRWLRIFDVIDVYGF